MAAQTRISSLVTGLSMAAIALAALSWRAQAQSPQVDEQPYVAVVTGDDVYVRSGPADSYYPFGKVNSTTLVKVMGEKYSWARIAAIGPAFKEMFGYIKYEKGDAGKLRLDADGKTAVTLGRLDVLAPNMDNKFNPGDSWKALVKLDVDQKLTILETTETDTSVIHKVALPEVAQGWIAMAYLRRATPDEANQWAAALKPGGNAPLREVPKPDAKPTAAAGTTAAPMTKDSPGYTTPRTEDGVTQIEIVAEMANTATTETSPTDGATPVAANMPQEATPEPAPPKEPTLEDLEGAFKLLQKEPIETAEVIPLRELYLALGRKNPNDTKTMHYVTARTDQLQIWADLQKKRQELDSVRSRLKSSADETDAAWRKLEASAEYTAVGRVAASTIYDGKGLPKLLRLQDGGTGRTLAYLQPDEKYELVNLIGNFVGIVGDKTYDETLRLNIISPRRIDILTPTE
jgi:hypothetical protein